MPVSKKPFEVTLPDGSIRNGYRIDFAGIITSIVYDITESDAEDIKDRVAEILAPHYGYVKPIRCKDCGSFIPMCIGDSVTKWWSCSYFKCGVPCEHYCSYAWEDEDE